MDVAVWSAFLLTMKVSVLGILLAAPPAIALAYLLARRDFFAKSLVETLAAIPLVLPPIAIGYLLLGAFGRTGPLGQAGLGFDVLLDWKGAVLASAVMAFPLVTRSARVAFEEVDRRLELMAASLGHRPLEVFARITLPLARRGLLAAIVLGFGRAIGEFGATIIVAGNIPGKTQTLALLLFNDIQLGRDGRAATIFGITLVLAFLLMLLANRLQARGAKRGAVDA